MDIYIDTNTKQFMVACISCLGMYPMIGALSGKLVHLPERNNYDYVLFLCEQCGKSKSVTKGAYGVINVIPK